MFDQWSAWSPSIRASAISASRVWKPRFIAAWIRLCALRVAHPLAEEIGIATEVLDGRESYRIDPVLDHGVTGGRKAGDPVSERSDEVTECSGRQRSIDPPVSFSQLRLVIPALNMTSSARARPMMRARCWAAPPPGSTPNAGSN